MGSTSSSSFASRSGSRPTAEFEAGFTFGGGAARVNGWQAWFQVALGLRVDLGPVFLAGEIGFEQNSLIDLAAGVGLKLF